MARPTSAQQVKRNRQIVLDEARGYTWDTIAERHGVSARRAQQIWREWQESPDRAEGVDEQVAIDDEIALLTQAIEDYAELAATSENDSVKLGAMNSKIRTQDRRIALYRAVGALPYELYRVKNRMDVAKINDVVGQALHDLEGSIPDPDAAKKFMNTLIELYWKLSNDPATDRACEAEERQQKTLEKEKSERRLERQRRQAERRREWERHEAERRRQEQDANGPESSAA